MIDAFIVMQDRIARSRLAGDPPDLMVSPKLGAIGLFEEGEGDDFCELKNWLLLRVMWEPKLDDAKLIDEFLRGYYGEAVAPPCSVAPGAPTSGRDDMVGCAGCVGG